MSINLCNTDYEKYDPEEAILMWLRSGKPPRGFTKPYRPQPKQVDAAWESEDEQS